MHRGLRRRSRNDRFRDLIDLPLLYELTDRVALGGVKDACVEIFELRGTHAWPPTVTVWPSWPAGFESVAREIEFFTDDVDVAAEGLRALIAEIDGASPASGARPGTADG